MFSLFASNTQNLWPPLTHMFPDKTDTRWCPSSLAKLVNITPITMVRFMVDTSILTMVIYNMLGIFVVRGLKFHSWHTYYRTEHVLDALAYRQGTSVDIIFTDGIMRLDPRCQDASHTKYPTWTLDDFRHHVLTVSCQVRNKSMLGNVMGALLLRVLSLMKTFQGCLLGVWVLWDLPPSLKAPTACFGSQRAFKPVIKAPKCDDCLK